MSLCIVLYVAHVTFAVGRKDILFVLFVNIGLHENLFQKHVFICSFKSCFLPNLKIFQKFV